MSRSQRLLQRCSLPLASATGMRFVREVHDGTIDDRACANYLRIEREFVDTAARLHGLAAWQAPHWSAVVRNAAALHALTTEQNTHFAAGSGQSTAAVRTSGIAARHADALTEFTLAAARQGGYPAITTVLFAAETLYLTWCTRAHHEGSPPEGPIADWVALHVREPFISGVAALATAVDELPEHISDEQLAEWFNGMLSAEITFHDSIYADP